MPDKKNKIQAPRGVKDILPAEQKYWFWMENNFYASAHAAGFDRIILPTFESTELFKRSVGEFTDIVSKEMYTFHDKSDNSLTLRPEGTAGAVRAFIEHGMHTLPQPVKLFYFGPMFRYDRPQAGRYREFYQFGLEVLGGTEPLLDAMLIQTVVRFYSRIGLRDIVVKINSLGADKTKAKLAKTLEKLLEKHKKDLCEDCKIRLKKNPLRVLDCKEKSCKEIVAGFGNVLIDNLDSDSKKRFTKVLEYLDEAEINYELDTSLVRGLDYYAHTIFEVTVAGSDIAIGGGGRYDNLVKDLGGPNIPAIGYAGGVERTIELLKQQEFLVPEIIKTDIFVVQIGDRAEVKANNVVKKLENAGLRVSSAFKRNAGIQAQLKEASNFNSPLVVIIGDQEVHDGSIILRDMNDRSQETVIDKNLLKMVAKRLEEKGMRINLRCYE